MIDSSFNTLIELNKKNQNQAKDYHGMKARLYHRGPESSQFEIPET